MFLCELDGYAPAGGAVREKPRLTLADLDTRFRAFLLDVYHRRDNAETKMAPIERWEANGFMPRMPDSLEQLDLLLIQVAKARQVRADGIHFHGLRYISTTPAACVGEMVMPRFDPRDMAEIRIFHGERFCAGRSVRTLPALQFRSEKLRAPGIAGDANCAAFCGSGGSPSIRCSTSSAGKTRRRKMRHQNPHQQHNPQLLSNATETNASILWTWWRRLNTGGSPNSATLAGVMDISAFASDHPALARPVGAELQPLGRGKGKRPLEFRSG